MTLPEIQLQLRKIAIVLGGLEEYVDNLANEMQRRKPTRKSKPTSAPMTPALKRAIKATATANPEWSYAKIANKHKVNSGRVSEVLRGKRK